MKKLTLLIAAFLVSLSFTLQAQKSFVGEILIKTTLKGTDDPNLLGALDAHEYSATILGNKQKITIKSEQGELVQMIDMDKNTFTFFIEINGLGKFYKRVPIEKLTDRIKNIDFKYTYHDEFKTILDYKCQKVTVIATNLEDDVEEITEMHVTKEIGNANLNVTEYRGLEGTALLINKAAPEICETCVMVIEAYKITPSKKLKEVDFLLPDDAQNIDDNPELLEMFGDMGF